MPEKLIDIVCREGVDHLKAYFALGAYTGQWFETFAGGGDRAETRDRITAEDLYAVEALSVQVAFAVGKELVEGQLGSDIGAHLRELSTQVELGTRGGDELVADGGHADQVWRILNNRNEKTGIGWVIAGKLLARKRPKLIPVYDSIVSCQFGAASPAPAPMPSSNALSASTSPTCLPATETGRGGRRGPDICERALRPAAMMTP